MDQESTPVQMQLRQALSPPGRLVKWNIVKVYVYILMGLLVSSVTIQVLSSSETLVGMVRNNFIITLCITLLLMAVNTNIFKEIPYESSKWSKISCWIINCILIAVPMLNSETAELRKGFLYTLLTFIILSFSCMVIPRCLIESYIHPLMVLHSLVLVCTVSAILFKSLDFFIVRGIKAVSLYGGLLEYSTLIICNTHRLILNTEHQTFDPLYTAFVLFTNFANLFSRMVVFAEKKPNVKYVKPNQC